MFQVLNLIYEPLQEKCYKRNNLKNSPVSLLFVKFRVCELCPFQEWYVWPMHDTWKSTKRYHVLKSGLGFSYLVVEVPYFVCPKWLFWGKQTHRRIQNIYKSIKARNRKTKQRGKRSWRSILMKKQQIQIWRHTATCVLDILKMKKVTMLTEALAGSIKKKVKL